MIKLLRKHAKAKSITAIVLLLLLISVILLKLGYNIFSDSILEQYSDGAYLTAKTAAKLVDADKMDEYVSSGGVTEEYLEVWNAMDSLCNSSGSTFIYVIIPQDNYEHIKFIFSTIDHNSTYSIYDFGYLRDTTNDEYKQKYAALYNKETEKELVLRDKGYIETDSHITLIVPLIDSTGTVRALLCVQRQMDVLAGVRQKFLTQAIIAIAILIVITIVGQSVFLNYLLLRPLKIISEETERFSGENTLPDKKLTKKIKNIDEIGALATSIDVMEEQIHNYIDNITNITAEKQRINTELNLATKIQAGMLPNKFPAFSDKTQFDIFASMNPAKEVGGDFYDFFLIDDDHLCLMIADVSGKGVPAALFMMASKIILANNAVVKKSPAEILKDTNTAICNNNHVEMFVTVWLGILELSTGKLTAANAGHEYPVLKQPNGEFEIVKDKHGFVIGGMSGMQYKEYELVLKKGAKLFLYTDGVPEATNGDNQLFGMERMLISLNEGKDLSPEKLLEKVRVDVDKFVDGAEQFDDLTMLCLEYKGE